MPSTKRASPIAKAIGQRIQALREERGLDIPQFAKLLGYSPSAIKQIQNGTNATQFAKLGEICEVLGTTPNVLLGFPEPSRAITASEPVLNEELLTAAIEAVLMDLGWSVQDAVDAALAIVRASREAPMPGLDQKASAQAMAVAQIRTVRRGKPQ